MELKDRIAAVRRAAGLTQEQLGALLGVTRQAVSKWESGQTAPDAATLAALCEQLHVSADYVLLGREPEESQSAGPAYEMPDTCPCCGRKVSGSICPGCGYHVPNYPPRGARYAVTATRPGSASPRTKLTSPSPTMWMTSPASCCGGGWTTARPNILPLI